MTQQPPPPPPQNGTAQELPVPGVKLIYRTLPNGMRIVLAIEVAGIRFGGVTAVHTGFDAVEPKAQGLPPSLINLRIDTFWPFEWLSEHAAQEIVVARESDVPPPPTNRFKH